MASGGLEEGEMNRVKGKTAFITGAASGLGEACALLLAKEGAEIVVTGINESKGHEVVENIRQEGGKVIFVKLDVSKEPDWENAHPMGSLGKPIDVAYGVLYLASDESRMVTGAEMVIDGGWVGPLK